MSKPIIEVKGLSKKYRLGQIGATSLREEIERFFAHMRNPNSPIHSEQDFWALEDVSFDVWPDEILGIIGRNGAGKSTLLKILSRITEPTEGEAILRGRVASLLEVGTGFHPELTGRENVYLNGAILGMKKREIDACFDEIVAFAEMEKHIDTPVKRYSSGQCVRLAFAVAAHLEAEILIIDEVLAVGDAAFQKKCMGKMKDVSRRGRTVLFVSHNMQAVSTLTTRCLVVEAGKILLSGTPMEAVGTYLRSVVSQDDFYQSAAVPEKTGFTRVSLKTSEPGMVQRHGEAMSVILDLYTPERVEGAQVSIQIVTELDVPVVHLALFEKDAVFFEEAGHYRIVCRIPAIRLYMGSYHLKVHLGSTRGHRHLQTVEGICPFTVVMHGIERPWPWRANECLYMEDCAWQSSKLESGEDAQG